MPGSQQRVADLFVAVERSGGRIVSYFVCRSQARAPAVQNSKGEKSQARVPFGKLRAGSVPHKKSGTRQKPGFSI